MTRQAESPNDSRFQSLLDRGLSPEKAQRIVNAEADGDAAIAEPETYADWTDKELHTHAVDLGIEEQAGMNRGDLIAAIRER